MVKKGAMFDELSQLANLNSLVQPDNHCVQIILIFDWPREGWSFKYL